MYISISISVYIYISIYLYIWVGTKFVKEQNKYFKVHSKKNSNNKKNQVKDWCFVSIIFEVYHTEMC